ncbi:MAG: cyclic lactone autoinducer peptide [Desulfotomaculum sp.]|nr:cyclic lactone autoinducer peptide [Desulfotomaculum sp.]
MINKIKHAAMSMSAAAFALVAVTNVDAASFFLFYEPEIPAKLQK